MGKVIFNMTTSLDGFVAGPNNSPEQGLGEGGEAPGVTHMAFRVVK